MVVFYLFLPPGSCSSGKTDGNPLNLMAQTKIDPMPSQRSAQGCFRIDMLDKARWFVPVPSLVPRSLLLQAGHQLVSLVASGGELRLGRPHLGLCRDLSPLLVWQ